MIKQVIEAENLIVLHLNLKRKWFKMIYNGDKKREYREISYYWNRFFSRDGKIRVNGVWYPANQVHILFSNGYSIGRWQMLVQCTGLKTTHGFEEWGGSPKKQYHTLMLGNVICSENMPKSMVRIEKISELPDAVHPCNIPVGYVKEGTFFDYPKLNCRFRVGAGWSTSVVREIIDSQTFRTLNSIYKYSIYEK